MDLDGLTAEVDDLLAEADEAAGRHYPGPRDDPGPLQTLYVLAGDFHADLVRDAGREAEQLVLQHAEEFLALLGGDDALMGQVLEKLAHEPVDDLRLDFTTWTGDRVVDRAAQAFAAALETGAVPARSGIRIPSLAPEQRERALRTLTRFLDGMGRLPEGFVVTVRDVTSRAHVAALVHVAERVEKDLEGRLRFELQVESPQAVIGPKGTVVLARMLHEGGGRLEAVHLVPDAFGSVRLADHALTLARTVGHGTGVRLGDGATLPVPDVADVLPGWQQHLDGVRRSLARGFALGRDTHPAQLPTRYAGAFGHARLEVDSV